MPRKLTTEHLKEYKIGGKFFKLFNVVDKDPELSFEIRQKDEVKIYYCKKVMAIISKGKRIKPLSPKYCKDGTGPSVDITLPEVLKSEALIKKYFKQAKDIAYKHSKKAEFTVQQNISLGSRCFDEGLVVVDMEWGFSQGDIPEKQRISKTQIDLVAVNPKVNENGENDIYLVEVKHSLDATEGDSGMQDHVNKTNEICNCHAACEALIEDVKAIIDQKVELGILTGNKPDFKFSRVPKMMFFLSYRSQDELSSLERQVAKLDIPTGMTTPVVQYYNYTIPLSL